MDRAKAAIKEHLGKGGHHTTDLEQTMLAPVTHEQIQEHQVENTTTVLDREIHEHHHQTSVQPIADKQILPEQHHHNVAAVEHRTQHHGKDHEIEARLAAEAQQFRDKTEVLETQHHRGKVETLGAEHHHHHIHENIQPLIQKETIQQHVVHNVIPIHEEIHRDPTVHKTTINPVMSLSEFKSAGGLETGTHREHHEYTGDPLAVDPQANVSIGKHQYAGHQVGGFPDNQSGALASREASTLEGNHHHHLGKGAAAGAATGVALGAEHHHHNKHHDGLGGTTTSGPHNSNIENKLDPRVDSDRDGSRTVGGGYGTGTTTGAGAGTGYGTTGSGLTGHSGTGTGLTGTGTTGSHIPGMHGDTTGGLGGQRNMIDSDVHTESGEKQSTMGKIMSKITGKE